MAKATHEIEFRFASGTTTSLINAQTKVARSLKDALRRIDEIQLDIEQAIVAADKVTEAIGQIQPHIATPRKRGRGLVPSRKGKGKGKGRGIG